MANKHIINPCSFTGEIDETVSTLWRYPESNKVSTLCPKCNNVVSVNRVTKRLRKHTGISDQYHLVQSFEE